MTNFDITNSTPVSLSEMSSIHLGRDDGVTSARQFPTPAKIRWTTLDDFKLWCDVTDGSRRRASGNLASDGKLKIGQIVGSHLFRAVEEEKAGVPH